MLAPYRRATFPGPFGAVLEGDGQISEAILDEGAIVIVAETFGVSGGGLKSVFYGNRGRSRETLPREGRVWRPSLSEVIMCC